jgi:phage terminase small subunit
MPALSNPRHEKFAQNIVQGMNRTKAYEMAGYSKDDGNATRLLTVNDSIRNRVVELFDETVPFVKWTREEVNHQLTDLLMQAKAAKKIEAATRLVEQIAKVNGLVIHRSETGKAGEFDALSDQELIEILATPLGEEPGAD